MTAQARLMERLAFAGALNPQAMTTAAAASQLIGPAVDISKGNRVVAALSIGINSGTVGMEIKYGTSTVGTDATAFSPALQITGATAGSLQKFIEIESIDVQNKGGKTARYLFAVVTANLANALTAVVGVDMFVGDLRNQPAAHGSAVAGIYSADVLR